MHKHLLIKLFLVAFLIKFNIFIFACLHAPDAKYEADSYGYLELSDVLHKRHAFTRLATFDENSKFYLERFRTPGFPVFLLIFHHILKIPLSGVVFVQILISLLSAFIVYKTASLINEKIAVLSCAVMLFDPTLTVYSLMLLTETLFIFILALLLWIFVLYLKTNKVKFLILSAILVAAAAYTRPVAFFFAIPLAIAIIIFHIRKNFLQAIGHTLILLIIAHGLIGIWQWRNFQHHKTWSFSSIDTITIGDEAGTGLFKSYARNRDDVSQGLPPWAYYVNVTSRCFASLMTRPSSFKNFNSKFLKAMGKTVEYPWILFWWIGLLAGITRMNNIYYQSALLVILYFAAVTIIATMWGASARFRTPMMPFIAILSAWGWQVLKDKFRLHK